MENAQNLAQTEISEEAAALPVRVDGRLLPQPMDVELAKTSEALWQSARAKKQYRRSTAVAAQANLTDFQKAYRQGVNAPVERNAFSVAMQSLQNRYAAASAYQSPITYAEAGDLFRTIIAGELARTGRRPYFTGADSRVIRGLLQWFIRDPTGPYDLHRGIYLHGPVGVGKSLIMKCLKIMVANVPIQPSRFDIAPTKGLLADIAIEKNFSALAKFKRGVWLQEDLMDEKRGESASYAERLDVMDWLLTERAILYVDQGLCTHVTSNLGRDNVEKFYGTRIADRFDELVQFVELTGHSKRAVDRPVLSEKINTIDSTSPQVG